MTINQIKEGRLVLVTHQAGPETQNIIFLTIFNSNISIAYHQKYVKPRNLKIAKDDFAG